MAAPTVAVEVIETLRDLGVRHVFGVPSGGWVDYMEALRTTDGIEFVLTTHEGAAGMMADVCGRITGVPGVCFGTYGPGATNLSTGVGEALLDRLHWKVTPAFVVMTAITAAFGFAYQSLVTFRRPLAAA